MKPVRISALAAEDLTAVRDWYEDEREGLGLRFVDAVSALAATIAEMPRRFPIVDGDVRRAEVRPFPYGLYFSEREAEIEVVAVTHLRRHPSSWRRPR